MNFNKFINSDYLKENPLCGIDTYKDELNLTTGECTRRMKKLVLTGNETWYRSSRYTGSMFAYFSQFAGIVKSSPIYCSHLIDIDDISQYQRGTCIVDDISVNLWLFPNSTTPDTLKRYLAAQYANGTPVTVWYVLATPTTEVITVPSGLSGIVEGYLNQSDTPTPTNPIYPTANTVEQWFDIPHYIHKTDTDTITTFPAVLYPNDTTATVGLKGQAVQSTTPTPDNPIMPEGTGERTAQLIDYPYFTADGLLSGVTWVTTIHSIKASGVTNGGTNFYIFRNKLIKAGTYRITINGTHKGMSLLLRDTSTSTMIANLNSTTDTSTFTLESDMTTCSLYFNQGSANVSVDIDCTIMLNLGSTALPYEPYGIKIPISSANTTTPIYLGEVETTRRVKKLVFDGTENVDLNTVDKNRLIIQTVYTLPQTGTKTPTNIMCSHLKTSASGSATSMEQGIAMRYNGTDILFGVPFSLVGATTEDSNATIRTKVKSYLAAQYAAGTPVTIWYVLATEETAVVNEPLMKIGDYADEVSDVTIPVTAGGNTLSVDTTVKPSEVTVNYKGWHPVQSAHEKSKNLWDNRGFSATAINLNYTHNISNNYGTTLSTTEGNEVTITQSAYPTGNSGYQNGFFTIDVDFSKYAIGDVITISLDYIVNEIHALSTQNATTVYAGKDSNIVPNTLSSGDWKISGRLTATITIIADMRPYVEVRLCGNSITVKNIMLNEGSTALPYEPYWN